MLTSTGYNDRGRGFSEEVRVNEEADMVSGETRPSRILTRKDTFAVPSSKIVLAP